MADQNGVILFLVISVIALWGIVMVLAAVYLAAFLKRRGQLKGTAYWEIYARESGKHRLFRLGLRRLH